MRSTAALEAQYQASFAKGKMYPYHNGRRVLRLEDANQDRSLEMTGTLVQEFLQADPVPG